MTAFDETRLAELLRALPPAPPAWVAAAKELPPARRGLDDIVRRAEADEEFRRAVVADLEKALARAGFHPDPALVEELRKRLS